MKRWGVFFLDFRLTSFARGGCLFLFACGICFFLFACGKIDNSSSGDKTMYGEGGQTGSLAFVGAVSVLGSYCYRCHSDWSSYTESEFMSSGLVARGNPNGSALFYRIRGNDSGTTGDMPPSGSSPSAEELKKIKTWIEGI